MNELRIIKEVHSGDVSSRTEVVIPTELAGNIMAHVRDWVLLKALPNDAQLLKPEAYVREK